MCAILKTNPMHFGTCLLNMKSLKFLNINEIMKITHLDHLLICYIRESPWVNLNFIWVMGAVQVPVNL